jgi:hypothetical protein
MNDLLLIIGQKEVEIALLRHQIAVLTDQVQALTPAPAPSQPEPTR